MIKTSGCHGRLLKTSLLLVSLAVMMTLLFSPKLDSGSQIYYFSRRDGSVGSGNVAHAKVKSNCGMINCIFMVFGLFH